jgi:hypothetical protein
MTSDHPRQSPDLEEIYTLIDKNRVAAAKAAQAKFHNDIEAAIATIVSIGAIAGTRVQADSRIASAKVLINAELAATRLLAEAEVQASKWANQAMTKPKEVVEAALMDIGKQTSSRLIATAKESVAQIEQDAEAAIKVLRETGATAIREVQAMAAHVAEQTKRDAELAAEKLKEYRKHMRTPADAASEGEDLARIVIKAAEEASVNLQETLKATLANINAMTDAACAAVHEAALASEKKIAEGLELALARLQETMKTHS